MNKNIKNWFHTNKPMKKENKKSWILTIKLMQIKKRCNFT